MLAINSYLNPKNNNLYANGITLTFYQQTLTSNITSMYNFSLNNIIEQYNKLHPDVLYCNNIVE